MLGRGSKFQTCPLGKCVRMPTPLFVSCHLHFFLLTINDIKSCLTKKITTMKKNLIWCFLAVITAGLLCISLVSCDKDDTFSTPVNASHLVGR